MNYPDSLIKKRFKTQISAQISPSATTNKKQSKKSKILTKSSSQLSIKKLFNTIFPALIAKIHSSQKIRKILQQIMYNFTQQKISQISDIKHINSKIPRKSINSANTIPSRMIKSIVEKSMLTSQIGDSIPMRSENNTYDTIYSSIIDLNLMINSIDIRLIKKMEVDNEANKKPITMQFSISKEL